MRANLKLTLVEEAGLLQHSVTEPANCPVELRLVLVKCLRTAHLEDNALRILRWGFGVGEGRQGGEEGGEGGGMGEAV